ncbi:hypothetical protein [Caballeronia sp. INDeC2]|uniref:hypothetical protein n=1 Tax=Caballeronia sp. INDeC2 TaxID=2921747 RepID=UPI0020282972|nr:hypothetical protein [Caballeronia sp. INDeC2]
MLVAPLAGAGLDAANGADAPLSDGLDAAAGLEAADGAACEPPVVVAPPLSPPPPPHAANMKATAKLNNMESRPGE